MTPGNGPNGPYDWRTMRNQRRMRHMQWRAQRAAWRAQHPGHGHAIVGVILLIIGVVFLLTNLGVFSNEDVRKYWPALLIAWGAVTAVLGHRGAHRLLWGGALMVIGGLLLAQNFGYIHGDVWQVIWPVMLIFLGI